MLTLTTIALAKRLFEKYASIPNIWNEYPTGLFEGLSESEQEVWKEIASEAIRSFNEALKAVADAVEADAR